MLALCVLLGVVAVADGVLRPVSPPAGEVADRILADPRITLADGARTAIEDTAAGVPARGGLRLSAAMLEGMLTQAAAYRFRVSETTGGAFDVDLIGGRPLDASGGVETQFMERCRTGGATEVRSEVHQIHCSWG